MDDECRSQHYSRLTAVSDVLSASWMTGGGHGVVMACGVWGGVLSADPKLVSLHPNELPTLWFRQGDVLTFFSAKVPIGSQAL